MVGCGAGGRAGADEEEGGRGRGKVEEVETEEWMRTRTLELGDGAAEVVLDAGHACVSVVLGVACAACVRG